MTSNADWPVLRRWTMTLTVSCAMTALPTVAFGAGVAMVTDLQGRASASGDGPPALTILAELQPGAQVDLEAGATLVVLYLDAGDEYVFKGPAAIVFRPLQPEVVSGQKPEKRSALGKGGKDIRIKPVGMAQAAIVMRGSPANARIQLLNLRQTRTLETQPEFRWQAQQPGLKYGFRLSDDTGRTLVETTLSTTPFKLPPTVAFTG